MKVKVFEMTTTAGKRYGLKNAESGDVVRYPHHAWKTAKAARAYARKMGWELADEA